MSRVRGLMYHDIRRVLSEGSPNYSDQTEKLIAELQPEWLEDRELRRCLFRGATGKPNRIVFGLQGLIRLQAHAYAFAMIATAPTKSLADRDVVFRAVDKILKWAVEGDFTKICQDDQSLVAFEDSQCVLRESLSGDTFSQLTPSQRATGRSVCQSAIAWIFHNELARLKLRYVHEFEVESCALNIDADQYASQWTIGSSEIRRKQPPTPQLSEALWGTVAAAVWLTIEEAFLGPRELSDHQQAFARLFRVADFIIDADNEAEFANVWDSIAVMFRISMRRHQFRFRDPDTMLEREDPKQQVIELADRILHSIRQPV